MKVIKVKAGSGMCPDFEALDDSVMRYVGRRFDPAIGHTRPKKLGGGQQGGWVSTGEVVEVPFRKEYLEELQAGALLPGDEETARFCGVPFPG